MVRQGIRALLERDLPASMCSTRPRRVRDGRRPAGAGRRHRRPVARRRNVEGLCRSCARRSIVRHRGLHRQRGRASWPTRSSGVKGYVRKDPRGGPVRAIRAQDGSSTWTRRSRRRSGSRGLPHAHRAPERDPPMLAEGCRRTPSPGSSGSRRTVRTHTSASSPSSTRHADPGCRHRHPQRLIQ